MDYFTAIAKLLGGSNEMTATVADEVWQFEKSLAAVGGHFTKKPHIL